MSLRYLSLAARFARGYAAGAGPALSDVHQQCGPAVPRGSGIPFLLGRARGEFSTVRWIKLDPAPSLLVAPAPDGKKSAREGEGFQALSIRMRSRPWAFGLSRILGEARCKRSIGHRSRKGKKVFCRGNRRSPCCIGSTAIGMSARPLTKNQR